MDRGLPDVEWLITLQHKVDAAYRPFNSQHVVQLPWLCYKIDAFTSSLTKLPHRSTTRKGLKMSNSPSNREQSQLLALTPSQLNPGAAIPSDFIIEARDEGHSMGIRRTASSHTRVNMGNTRCRRQRFRRSSP
jgi:hypothetical protein